MDHHNSEDNGLDDTWGLNPSVDEAPALAIAVPTVTAVAPGVDLSSSLDNLFDAVGQAPAVDSRLRRANNDAKRTYNQQFAEEKPKKKKLGLTRLPDFLEQVKQDAADMGAGGADGENFGEGPGNNDGAVGHFQPFSNQEGAAIAAAVTENIVLKRLHYKRKECANKTKPPRNKVGVWKRCRHPDGCDKHAAQGGFCIAHGGKHGERKCKWAEGCEKIAQKGGLCKRHFKLHMDGLERAVKHIQAPLAAAAAVTATEKLGSRKMHWKNHMEVLESVVMQQLEGAGEPDKPEKSDKPAKAPKQSSASKSKKKKAAPSPPQEEPVPFQPLPIYEGGSLAKSSSDEDSDAEYF